MKIDSKVYDGVEQISQPLKSSNPKTAYVKDAILTDNGYSSLKQKELNNRIGILQIAKQTIDKIISNSSLSLNEAESILREANFLGNSIFSQQMILKDSYGNTLFDANRILDQLPSDNRDLYMFKKTLKSESDFISHSLDTLKADMPSMKDIDTNEMKSYLSNSAMLFAKAHDTRALALKIDALLA